MGGVGAQLFRRQQEDLRVGLGVFDLLAGYQRLEVVGQPPVVQVALDDVDPAGGGHCHGDVVGIQPGQQLVQPRLFGHRFLELLIGHPVQAVDDGVGIAVLSVELPYDVTGSFTCCAAFSLGKAFLVLQTQRRQCRFPESGPHPLGVEHQAVHIKNHAVDHGRTPFIITLSVIASQCHLSRRERLFCLLGKVFAKPKSKCRNGLPLWGSWQRHRR